MNSQLDNKVIEDKYNEYLKLKSNVELQKYINKNCKYNDQYKNREAICEALMWISSYAFIHMILGITVFKEFEWWMPICLIFTGIVPIIHGCIFDFFWDILTKKRQQEEKKEKEYLAKKYEDSLYKEYEYYINLYESINPKKFNNTNNKRHKSNYRECPKCGGKLIRKNGRYGSFIGCSNYPRCRYTRSR